MAVEDNLRLNNTSPQRLINEAYKDCVFQMTQIGQLEELDTSNFKYILVVSINGRDVATLKSPTGFFNIQQVIQDYCRTDNSGYYRYFGGNQPQSEKGGVGFNNTPHSVHEIDKYSNNLNNLIRVNFKMGCSFTNDDTGLIYSGTPIEAKGPFLYNRYYFWNAAREHQEGDVTNFQTYILDGNTKRFLTNQEPDYKRLVRIQDYQTLAFFNGKFCTNKPASHGTDSYFTECFGSNVYRIYVELYDANGNFLYQGHVDNTAANGGYPQSNFYTNDNGVLVQENKGLLYVGVGPQNIIGNWVRGGGGTFVAAHFQAASSYKIWAAGSPNPNDRHSEFYHFTLQEDDCIYENVRLTYMNRKGAWDYMNFTKKSTRTTDITRSNFKQFYGHYPNTLNDKTNPAYNTWDYGAYSGGTKTYNVNAIVNVEANTNWLTESDALHMEELFTSPDVYMQNENNEYIPVVVTEKDYVRQTKANDKLIQYIIQVQYGHENRIQRL